MLYVRRNEQHQIIAVFKDPDFMADEAVSDADPEVDAFFRALKMGEAPEKIKEELTTTDVEMGRVLEDLIELLIQKNIILFTELPDSAQSKILTRKKIRDILKKII